MSRTFKWTLALAGLAALLALSVPWSLGDEALRREIADHIQQKTGLQASLDGRLVIALAPQPTLKIETVSFRDEGGGVDISAPVFKGALRLLPLFAGRLELNAISLSDATITIDIEHLPGPGIPDQRAGIRDQQTEPRGAINLVSSKLRVKSRDRIIAELAALDATADWPTSASAASIMASGLWQGERIEAALWIGRFDALRRSEGSAVTMKFDTPRATVSLNGNLELGVRPLFDGKLSVSAAALGDLLRNAGYENPFPMPMRALTATGNLKASSQNVALTDARISADGTAYEGSIAFANLDGRPLLSGTLAANQLQLAPFVAKFPVMLNAENAWNREPLVKPGLPHFDLDLRLSAARARLDRFQIQDAGIAIKAFNGQLDVSLIDARGYNGRLKGRFIAGARENGVSTKITASFQRIDAAAMFGDMFRLNVLAGEATGALTAEGEGDCLAEIVQSLNGRIEASIDNGDLLGIDLDQALRRTEKRPLSVVTEMRRGRTSFAKAGLTGRIADGMLEIDDAAATGFSLSTQIAGAFNLPDRTVRLKLSSVNTLADGSIKPDSPRLMLDILGSWDEPRLEIDFDSLLRKSEAAAPLLNSARPLATPAAVAP